MTEGVGPVGWTLRITGVLLAVSPVHLVVSAESEP